MTEPILIMDKVKDLLTTKFGHAEFQNHQEAIIRRLLVAQKSALGIVPTGGGKSLCYQLPALVLGLVVVVSPLKSLMKDQVEILDQHGIPAGQIHSGQTKNEYQDVVALIRSRELKILIITPERLGVQSFERLIGQCQVDLLVVDEAHCMAEWGDRFRPAYLNISRFVKDFSIGRVLCLTGTATIPVANGICQAFNIDPAEGVFRAPAYRLNLTLRVRISRDHRNSTEARQFLVKKYCEDTNGAKIIYTRLQDKTTALKDYLDRCHIGSRAYHGGMARADQNDTLQYFKTEADPIVCATNGFGMGIHRSDVRHIVHLNPPKSLEEYAQEIGRAGRDGQEAACVLYLAPGEQEVYENLIYAESPSEWSVRSFFEQFCNDATKQDIGVGGIVDIDFSNYSKQFDLSEDILYAIFAKLETELGYLRVLAPEYMTYDYKTGLERGSFPQAVQSDDSEAAKVIRKESKHNPKWVKICVTAAAREHKIDRSLLIAKLEGWHVDGILPEVKRHEEKHRYFILKELPTDPEEITSASNEVYGLVETITQKELGRVRQLFDWATSAECLPKSLSRYLGDLESFPGDAVCGNCSFCKNDHTPAVLPQPIGRPFNEIAFQEVLKALPKEWRFDAKLLARFAFRVSSPFITAQGLDGHRAFGRMSDHSWDAVLQRFQQVIDENPNSPPEYVPPPRKPESKASPSKKRKIEDNEDEAPEASGSSPKKPKSSKKTTPAPVQTNKLDSWLASGSQSQGK